MILHIYCLLQRTLPIAAQVATTLPKLAPLQVSCAILHIVSRFTCMRFSKEWPSTPTSKPIAPTLMRTRSMNLAALHSGPAVLA
jgi:hypothetical protein